MGIFVEIDSDGMVASVSRQRNRPDGLYEVVPPGKFMDPFTQVACTYMADDAAISHSMVDASGSLVPRPVVDPLSWDAATGTLIVPVMPTGTTIELHDLTGGELLWSGPASDVEPTTFTIADPGSYEIEVYPPAPYVEISMRFDHA